MYTLSDDHVTKLPSICSHLLWDYDNNTNIFQASLKVKDTAMVAWGMRINYVNGNQGVTVPLLTTYNLSEFKGATLKSSFKLDTSPLDVKMDTIYHVWGHFLTSDAPTMEDLEQSNGMSYGVLHLNNHRKKFTIVVTSFSFHMKDT
ncbi:hypothetical protein LIER_04014 [Lithospermum erythrorhizon]|uniref:Uncharacterized protein n=1 Tax=Lithospermum erythrorhizon TaxID=34254 RepID=A0AAV3NVC7_LITER